MDHQCIVQGKHFTWSYMQLDILNINKILMKRNNNSDVAEPTNDTTWEEITGVGCWLVMIVCKLWLFKLCDCIR